jgi:hypothetical protein
MGLAETLVATAMAAVVSIGILGFIQHAYKSQRNLRATQEFNDYVSMAQLALDDVKACTYNFGTVTGSTIDGMTLPDVGQQIAVNILEYDDKNPIQPRTSATVLNKDATGQDVDRTLVKTTVLKTISMTAPGRYIGRIIISATKTGEIVGARDVVQGFPVYFITDAFRKIISCYGNYSTSGLADLQQKQCEVLLGPDFFWNPMTNRCENRYETKCIPGTRTTGTCDQKTTAGLASGNIWYACTASGYYDPNEPPPMTRTYTDGGLMTFSPPRAYICTKIDQYTVKCDYAVGVDSTNSICSACCKVERPEVSAINGGP